MPGLQNGRRLAGMVVAVVVAATPATARQADPEGYLPLASGNVWTFFEVRFPPPDFAPDTVLTGPVQVDGSVVLNDTLYHVVPFPFAFTDTVRVDESGRVWGWQGGRSHLLFDVTRPDGVTYDLTLGSEIYTVEVTRNVSVETAAGTFDRAIRLRVDLPGALDAARTFTFAPGVGPVEIIGGMGELLRLFSATVAGVTVTGVEAAPPVDPAVAVFPNPFKESLTVHLRADRPGPGAIAVYDLLGRRVAMYEIPFSAPGTLVWNWDPAGLAGGVYLVRIRMGSRAWTLPAVRAQ